MDNYSSYLQTSHWKKTRARIMERSGGVCENDGCKKKAVQVHHITYDRLWQELDDDLQALCGPCHMKKHPDKISKNTGFVFEWRQAISRDRDMHKTTYAVLLTLTEGAHNDGSLIYPSQDRLAWMMKSTRATIAEHLRRAREAGWLSWERVPNPYGNCARGWVTMYTLHIPEGKQYLPDYREREFRSRWEEDMA